MVAAALADGTADRDCVFEVFARRLPHGRRYGVLAGTGRLLEALPHFRFGDDELDAAARAGHHRRSGCSTGWPTSGSAATSTATPRATSTSPARRCSPCARPFAEGVLLETLALSVLNHDSAIASAAARMVAAACERPCIEMGSRRTHEEAAVAAARAAYLVGFASTLQPRGRTALRRPDHRHQRARLHAAARRRGVGLPRAGGHPRPRDDAARRHLRRRPGHPDGGRGRRAGARRHPARLRRPADAGHPRPASCSTSSARRRPGSSSPATSTSTRSPGSWPRPVDRYGVGTSLVTGSGAPTVGHGLQARRARRRAGGEEVRGQGLGRRPQVRRPPARRRRASRWPRWSAAAPIAARDGDRDLVVPLVRGGRAAATRLTPGRGAGARPGRTTSGCARRCRRRRGRCPAASRCWRP